MTRYAYWTDEEREILDKNFGKCSPSDICALLPSHSYRAIQKMAYSRDRTNTYFRHPWTDAENDILANLYPTKDQDVILAALPGHSWKSIIQQAHRLSLIRVFCYGRANKFWTDEETNKLREIYPESPWDKILEAFPGKSKMSIHTQASKCGIARLCKPEAKPRRGVDVVCPFCGKTRYQPQCRVNKSGRGYYCSQECWGKAHTGDKSPGWRGGKHGEPYPLEFNEEFRQAIRQRDNYTCALCGEFGNDVHHINYIKHDIDPLNCITLCRSCHSKTGSNRAYWQSTLESLVQYLSSASR